jgi:SAM-dependent methyltransferase
LTSPQRLRRLIFGEVADLYDRYRPTYPEALFDELISFAGLKPGDPALEVGAGTGKATVALVRRGLALTALEPSHQMAEVNRANLAGSTGVNLLETSFEDWEPGSTRFRLICSAQAWHWVDAEIGYAKAARLLLPTGVLGLFWNRPEPTVDRLQTDLDEIYQRLAPTPPRGLPGEREIDRTEEIEGSGHFGPVALREFHWQVRYSVDEYKALLRTQSDHRMLEPQVLERLLQEVGTVLERAGGSLLCPYVTLLYLARPRG